MSGGEERGTVSGGSERRPVTYCLIPAELAPKLHDLLRDHFRDEPGVEVVVERRHRERRSGKDRRRSEGKPPARDERRRLLSATGRRVGERRAPLVEVEPPELPRRARRYAERLSFVERLEPSTQELEDRDTARLVARFQAGEREAFTTLYARYFDRVYGYLRIALRDPHEAEDATQQVFLKLFEALPRYERRRQPFRAWLFVLVRNQAISRLRKQRGLAIEDPIEIERHRALAAEAEEISPMLDWLSDRDLMLFVERLPLAQRQVLLLRYMLDLSNRQIAEILDRTPVDVSRLHHRAVTFLRARLEAVGRVPGGRGQRAEWHRRTARVQVLRARRFALTWRA